MVLIENIFSNPAFDYYDIFEKNRNVFIMSPTYKSGSMRIKGVPDENIRDHLDISLLAKIQEEQEENIKDYIKNSDAKYLISFILASCSTRPSFIEVTKSRRF